MQKQINPGNLVIYNEEGETYASIITNKTGNSKFRYYCVGENMLGMIMDYQVEELQIKGLNTKVKRVYSSIEEILQETNKQYLEEALSVLMYYIGASTPQDITLYPLLQSKKFTPEEFQNIYNNSDKKTQDILINNGFVNMFNKEDADKILEKIDNEEELLLFVKSKNNRNNYFNTDSSELIFSKLNEFVQSEKIKNLIEFKLIMASEVFVHKHISEVIQQIKKINVLNEANKLLFIQRLAPILNGLKHISKDKSQETKINRIVETLKENNNFMQEIENNIEILFEDLIADKDYNLGKYFNIKDILTKEKEFELISKIPTHILLKYKDLSNDSITNIVKSGLHREQYEDNSSATEQNINMLARHENTPSAVLEKIIQNNKTYLSMDSYGKWDVIDALQNSNLNIDFLNKIVTDNIEDKAFVFGAIQNPNCPSELKNIIKEKYPEKIVYNTSGYRMVYDYKEEENKQKQKTKNTYKQ